MPYILAALLLLAFGALLYRAYMERKEATILFKGVVLVVAGIFFVTFSRSMIVYKPLMVLHIAAVLLYGWGVILYLTRREMKVSLLAAPLATMALFFVVAWIFRET